MFLNSVTVRPKSHAGCPGSQKQRNAPFVYFWKCLHDRDVFCVCTCTHYAVIRRCLLEVLRFFSVLYGGGFPTLLALILSANLTAGSIHFHWVIAAAADTNGNVRCCGCSPQALVLVTLFKHLWPCMGGFPHRYTDPDSRAPPPRVTCSIYLQVFAVYDIAVYDIAVYDIAVYDIAS